MECDRVKFVFKKYSEKFPKLFMREKGKLKKFLPKTSLIEHIGSTSVPNLGGKGIIDILIAVPKKEVERTKKILESEGYWFRLKPKEDAERLFLERRYKYGGKVRLVHLHLTHYKSHVWKRIIALRNYLRRNRNIAKKYEKIKKQAINLNKKEKEYRAHKKEFLEKIEKMALKPIKQTGDKKMKKDKTEDCKCEDCGCDPCECNDKKEHEHQGCSDCSSCAGCGM